jgi:hypothetical protein
MYSHHARKFVTGPRRAAHGAPMNRDRQLGFIADMNWHAFYPTVR